MRFSKEVSFQDMRAVFPQTSGTKVLDHLWVSSHIRTDTDQSTHLTYFFSDRTFIGTNGKKYTWKVRVLGLKVSRCDLCRIYSMLLKISMQLYEVDDNSGNAERLVASYHRVNYIINRRKPFMKLYGEDYKGKDMLAMIISKSTSRSDVVLRTYRLCLITSHDVIL